MSSLFKKLQDDLLEARKNKSASLLGLSAIVSDVQRIAKDDGNRAPTDSDAINVIQKWLKGVNETIALTEKTGASDMLYQEKLFLESYLPQALSEQEIESLILVRETVEGENFGQIMKFFSTHFKGRYDAKKLAERLKK